MLENVRLNELYQKFAISPEMPDDGIDELTLEELTFIYAATETAKKDERFKEIHFPIRQQIIYWAAVEALKKAQVIYVAFSKAPNYPYIDPNGGAWIFSQEDLAVKLVDNLKENQQLELIVHKIENKDEKANMILSMVAQLYYLGVDKVVIDNGSHPMSIKRTDILPEPDWEKAGQPGQDFYNGALQLSMVQFFQYIQLNNSMQRALADESKSEEDKEAIKKKLTQGQQVLKMMESRMLSHLVDAKFLVPTVTMKDGKALAPGQNIEPGESVTRKIANLVDNNKVAWLPVFTDWPEFAKTYKPTEWGAIVLPYEGIVKLAKETKLNKIVFNARGCAFRVDDKLMENIENFRQRKAEFEAKRASEQGETPKAEETKKTESTPAPKPQNETDTKPEYEELSTSETPEMLVRALSRTITAMKELKPVKKMWLLKRTQKNQKDYGYLLVVGATADVTGGIEELKRASAGYLDGKTLEIRQEDSEVSELIRDIKPFYKRGLFG